MSGGMMLLRLTAPPAVGLGVFAWIVLPGPGLSWARFTVGAVAFLFTAAGLSLVANAACSRRQW